MVARLGDAPTMSGASSAVLLKVMLRSAFIAQSAASFHVSYFGGCPLRFRLVRASGVSLLAATRTAIIALRLYDSMSMSGLSCCMGLWGRVTPHRPSLYFCKIMKQPRTPTGIIFHNFSFTLLSLIHQSLCLLNFLLRMLGMRS